MRPSAPSTLFILLAVLALLLGPGSAPGEEGSGWPCWRGPNGDATTTYDGTLVSSMKDARLVWKSEAEILQTYPEGLGWNYIQSGQCGPIVYDDRVYLYHYDPSGTVYDKVWVARAKEMITSKLHKYPWAKELSEEQLDAFLHKRFAVLADDVLLCVDAKTGKTLWRQAWKLQGVNHGFQQRGPGPAAKTGPHARPCAGDGKVFVLGSSAMLYAADATTGDTLWQTELPPRAPLMELVAKKLKVGKMVNIGKTFSGNCPAYTSGTVAVGCGNDLYGYDAATGEEKWVVKGVVTQTASPVVWRDQGKAYFITGKPALIDPTDGSLLWQRRGKPATNPDYLAVSGNTIVTLSRDQLERSAPTRKGKTTGNGVIGFTFDRTGISHAWTQPDVGMSHYIRCVAANGYFWGRNSGSNAPDFFYALDLKDGRIVAKSGKVWAGGRTSGSMIMVNDRIFMDRSDILIADPSNPELHVEDEVHGGTQLIPGHDDCLHANSVAQAFADGFLYVRLQDRLACFDLRQQ